MRAKTNFFPAQALVHGQDRSLRLPADDDGGGECSEYFDSLT